MTTINDYLAQRPFNDVSGGNTKNRFGADISPELRLVSSSFPPPPPLSFSTPTNVVTTKYNDPVGWKRAEVVEECFEINMLEQRNIVYDVGVYQRPLPTELTITNKTKDNSIHVKFTVPKFIQLDVVDEIEIGANSSKIIKFIINEEEALSLINQNILATSDYFIVDVTVQNITGPVYVPIDE